MMETMIPPQVGMRLRTKNRKEKKRKKEAIKKEREKAQKNKMREKERRDNATILLPPLCFKVAPCSS